MKYIIFIICLLFMSCGDETILLKGNPGEPGVNGVDGKDGTNGQNANNIYMVKFCPGDSVYPSIFNEYGFCVDNKMYGTYSANGGFSTYLPPGAYNSNAVGSSCSFTLLDNCEIE